MSNYSQGQWKLEKDVRKLLKLAQDVQEESVFLQEPLYIRFKTNYNLGSHRIFYSLYLGFKEMKFHKVFVYLCHKYLDNRICDFEEKCAAINALTTSYF